MITQFDVYAIVTEKIPQLAQQDYPCRGSLMIYATINYLTDYTRHAIEAHNVKNIKSCFAIAEDFYLHGDNLVRLLIENSFIYSLSPIDEMCAADKFLIRSIVPEVMLAVYNKQVKQGH